MSAKPNIRAFHPENERLKRAYLQHVHHVSRKGQASMDRIAASIDRFQSHSKGKPFRKFHLEQAVAFKRALDAERNERTGMPISASTKRQVLHDLKGFFHWLADQPGFKKRVTHSMADYFNADNRTMALANQARPVAYPSLQQVEHVLRAMPASTPIEKRDRAIIAFCLLTGARVDAIISARMGHVDIIEGLFFQDAREVHTKFSKTIDTWFFRASELTLGIFIDYYRNRRDIDLAAPSDPLFPATRIESVPGLGFQAVGLAGGHWRTTSPVRGILRKAFELAGLRYYNPHSFRHLLSALAKEHCTTLQEMQAWAQNFGHEDLVTTMQAYGKVTREQQREVIHKIYGKN
jgi:integrase